MIPDRNRIAVSLLQEATLALASVGIRHAVIHGLEGLPTSFGRDVDIMVDRSREGEALCILTERFLKSRITFYHHYNPVGTHQFLFQISPGQDSTFSFELDFLTRLKLRWGPILFTNIDDPIRDSGVLEGLPFSPWGSFVKRILIKTLAGHWETLARKRYDWRVDEQDVDLVESRLSHFFGKSCAGDLLKALQTEDLDTLQKVQGPMRQALYRRAWQTPSGWLAWLKEELAPLFQAGQGTPILAIVGPDGVGKTTVITQLQELVAQQTCFPRVKVKHWRPGLLPQLGRMKGVRAPAPGQAAPPREKAGAFGLVRQIYYSLDFLLGYWLIDRLEGNRLTVLIYDRCLLDMTVHPVRFGFSTTEGVRFLARFCRRPDVIVLLQDDPARIHARKDELPVAEIGRQFGAWARLVRSGHVDLEVNVSGGPETAAREIMRYFTAHVAPRRRLFSGLPEPKPSQTE